LRNCRQHRGDFNGRERSEPNCSDICGFSL
jgi:hypothetical protein